LHPVLFEIGGLKLYSYTFFFSLAFVVGLWTTKKEALSLGLGQEKIHRLFIPIFVFSLIGARVYYALGAYLYTQQNLPFWSLLTRGGLAFYGGFIGATLFLLLIPPRTWIEKSRLFNAFAPALALSQAIGRFGCFLNGCCHGKSCPLPWGVKIPVKQGEPGWGLLHHPSQAYEIIGLFIVFFLCRQANRRSSPKRPAWLIYLFCYGSLRFLVEFSRGDDIRGFMGPLSLSQWFSLLLITLSVFLDLWAKRNHNQEPNEA